MRRDTHVLDQARARLAQQAAAYAFGVAIEEIASPTRGKARVALARQVAIYLAHVAFELSLGRVALAFGRDRSTVAYACHKIEDARDDPKFDACMEDLEACLRTAPGPDLAPFRMAQ